MNAQIKGLRVSSVMFGLFALAQLTRLLVKPEVVIAGHVVPLWPSALACAVLGSLSVWMWRLTCRHI